MCAVQTPGYADNGSVYISLVCLDARTGRRVWRYQVACTLALAHGDSANRTFTPRLLDDGAGEGRETIELELHDPLGEASLGERRIVVTVEDEADTPTEPIEECVADNHAFASE